MRKCFWETFTTVESRSAESGMITRAMPVMSGEIVSIITKVPIKVASAVITVVTLWLRPVLRVSTSLVTRESTSPYGRDSKYFIGIRSIFSAISRRMR